MYNNTTLSSVVKLAHPTCLQAMKLLAVRTAYHGPASADKATANDCNFFGFTRHFAFPFGRIDDSYKHKRGKDKSVPWVACKARSTPCSKMVGSGDGGGSSGRGRGRGRRQIIVLLCAACAYISIADRSSLSVLIIDMKDELGWSAREEATIMSSFYYGTS